MIKIDKGIPVPQQRNLRAKYPFAEMEIGDSFYVVRGVAYMRSVASTRGKVLNRKFAVQAEGDGARVWRTE